MPSLWKLLRRRFCRHPGKRAWDINRLPDGRFRLRLYCPACGERWDVERAPVDLVEDAARGDQDMRTLMRRNMGLDEDA